MRFKLEAQHSKGIFFFISQARLESWYIYSICTIDSTAGIQHVLKTLIATLDWNLDIQEAVSLPNFIALNNFIELEKDKNITSLKKPLQKLGHKVKITNITSAIQAIKIVDKKLYGAADPRRKGVAIGN